MKRDPSENTKDLPRILAPNTGSKEAPSPGESMLTACAKISSERYQAFVENIEEGVYEVDIHGNFLYFNNSLAKMLGYSKEDVQFRNFSWFMDEENVQMARDAFRRVYETEKVVSDLVCNITQEDGRRRVVEFSANLIRNNEGEKIGFRGIARDITDKFETERALQASERRYRALLEFLPYPVVVFSLDGRVSYLNPAFTEIFGWTFQELEGKRIPYVPVGLEDETSENIRRLLEDRVILRHETQRLTREGRILDVVFRAAVFYETKDSPSGEVVILRDITREKRIARNNEALLRISMALPEYPELGDLLDFINSEVKRLLGTEGALVILLDEERNELHFESAAYEDAEAEKRVKHIRFPATRGIAGRVIRTGKPVIVPDTSKDPDFYPVVDKVAGFHTRNLLDVPLRSTDRIIGVLCAMNKKSGTFDQTDVELLNMIAGTVALSIENARFADQLKEAYRELASLNRAKDRVINHLSHELKTPVAVLSASLSTLRKKLEGMPKASWAPTMERADRNLGRILEMQYKIEDIMRAKDYQSGFVLSWLLEECADELEALVADEVGEGRITARLRQRIQEIFGPKTRKPERIALHQFVPELLEKIRPNFAHRGVEILTAIEKTSPTLIPRDVLEKVIVGLIKNAVENTPDEGRIEVSVGPRGKGSELIVRDYGVGITEENQRRIFEGFFSTRETLDYSSKRPYEFNAGGKGVDLLRTKIFSEKYNFKVEMVSTRCGYIPKDGDLCPGRISRCRFCSKPEDCHHSGGTTFTLRFPEAPTRQPGVGDPGGG